MNIYGISERYYYRHVVVWSPIKKVGRKKGYNAGRV